VPANKRSLAISLPPAVVADANVVLSALIGGRVRPVIASEHGPRCIAPEAIAGEIARHIPRLASKRGLDPALLFAALQVMPIDWKATSEYENHRQEPSGASLAATPMTGPPLRSRSS
jgi:PIN domain